MAGRGPSPKPADRRARRNADPIPTSVIRFEQAEQPPLPMSVCGDCDGKPVPAGAPPCVECTGAGKIDPWHPQTRAWWAMWAASPQAEHFMSTDWDYLLDTALMHHALWSKGQWTLAAELRLRVAKFGATPEDRARLRMGFADADAKDDRRKTPAANPAPERYADLHVLPPPAVSE